MSNSIGFTPKGDNILVQRPIVEEDRVGLIYLVQSYQKPPQEGVVLAVGPGRYSRDGIRIPLDVKVGDTVIFGEHSGVDIELYGKPLLVMRENEVTAIVSKEEKENKQ